MSVHGENLRSLKRSGYPNASDDMDDYDVADGVSWMADEIERLKPVPQSKTWEEKHEWDERG
jgi:hypothetical protein